MIVTVGVELTIPDNAAHTVLQALRALGYDALTRVERHERYRLTLPDSGLTRLEVVSALQRAEIIFNPNKHRMLIADDPFRLSVADDGSAEFEAVVIDLDDDTSKLARALRERFGLRELESVFQTTVWQLSDGGRSASRERLEWACRVLLCNPHSQLTAVHGRPVRTPVGNEAVIVET